MGELAFDGHVARVKSATLDLYHLYSKRPGWDLEVELDGAIPALAITGTGAKPALPGPSPMEVAYLDEPAVISVDGLPGGVVPSRSELLLTELGQGRVRITGTLHTSWRARRGGDVKDYPIWFDLDAALVT